MSSADRNSFARPAARGRSQRTGRIVSIHSYRGGTGKSNISANLAYLAASAGKRVAVLDSDLQAPGVHLLFGFDTDRMPHTLSDFFFNRCGLEEAAYNLKGLAELENIDGSIFLLPSRMSVDAIMQVVSEGYDVGKLDDQLNKLVDELKLDLLLIDTHPGFNEETLLTIAISDALRDFLAATAGVQAVTVRYGLSAGPEPEVRDTGRVEQLVAAGRLEEQKGFDVAIAAMRLVIDEAPGVRLAIAGYRDGDKPVDRRAQVAQVRAALPSLEHVIHVPYASGADDALPGAHEWDGLLAESGPLQFDSVPFGHPLYVLFSSGTTGLPMAASSWSTSRTRGSIGTWALATGSSGSPPPRG